VALADSLFTGKMFNGADAIKNGLADSTGTLEDAVRRASYLASRTGKNSSPQSSNQANMKFPNVAALFGFNTEASDDAEVQEDNMAAAETSLAALQQENTTLQQNSTVLQARVTELEGLNTTQAARISELEATSTEQATQITTLTEQNRTLETWRQNNRAIIAKEGDELNQDDQPKVKTEYEMAAEQARDKASKKKKIS
jgi:chromosome segregation ATPase